MIELPLTEEQLREITKNYLGIRYKYDKDGAFMAYADAWTISVDAIKWLIKKIKSI
jgi:hypothetical protein